MSPDSKHTTACILSLVLAISPIIWLFLSGHIDIADWLIMGAVANIVLITLFKLKNQALDSASVCFNLIILTIFGPFSCVAVGIFFLLNEIG